jgi:hypothetical protein
MLFRGLTVRLASLILGLCVVAGCRDTTSLSDLKQPTSRIAYPDTEVGFEKFMLELEDAHARTISVQGRMHDLLIPNSSAWFIQVFGPTNGPTLDFQYRNQLGYYFSRLYAYLPIYGRGQNHLVSTEYSEPGHLSPFVSDSELIPFANQRLKIYSASIATNDDGPWLKVGSFVYVDGTFRYLGTPSLAPDWGRFYASYDRPFEP